MRWGDPHRPVGRWIPRALLDRFDSVADWLDDEVFTWRITWSNVPVDWRVERWDILMVLIGVILCVIYSWWIDSWLYGMTVGPLIYIFGWMAFAWLRW